MTKRYHELSLGVHYLYKELRLACNRGPRPTPGQLFVLSKFDELVETVFYM